MQSSFPLASVDKRGPEKRSLNLHTVVLRAASPSPPGKESGFSDMTSCSRSRARKEGGREEAVQARTTQAPPARTAARGAAPMPGSPLGWVASHQLPKYADSLMVEDWHQTNERANSIPFPLRPEIRKFLPFGTRSTRRRPKSTPTSIENRWLRNDYASRDGL